MMVNNQPVINPDTSRPVDRYYLPVTRDNLPHYCAGHSLQISSYSQVYSVLVEPNFWGTIP